MLCVECVIRVLIDHCVESGPVIPNALFEIRVLSEAGLGSSSTLTLIGR